MFKKYKSILALVSVSLFAMLALGCGGDNDNEFVGVATGNSGSAQTGNLSFSFFKINPQIAGGVAQSTVRLQFALFSTPITDPTNPAQIEAATLVDLRLLDFAESIVLEDVPANTVTILVTAIDQDGFPLTLLQGTTNVVLGDTTPVDLGNPIEIQFEQLTVTPDPVDVAKNGDPVQLVFTLEFDNGSVFQLNSFDAPEASFSQLETVADISSTGLVTTEVGGQTTTATAFYTFNGIQLQSDFTINTYCLEIVESNDFIFIPTFGDQSLAQQLEFGVPTIFLLEFVGPDGVRLNVTEDPQTTYALETPVTGVTVDPATGFLTADGTAVGGDVVIIATYTDPDSGLVLTDSVTITLIDELIEAEN